jgi:hypothetical protein
MMKLADSITVGYASKGGNLEKLMKETGKKVHKLY